MSFYRQGNLDTQREENALKRPRDKQEQREDSHEKVEVEAGFVQL